MTYNPNGTDIRLDPADLVTLDGVQTKYIAINGQFPGPTIEVPLGAEVSLVLFAQRRSTAKKIISNYCGRFDKISWVSSLGLST